MCIWTMGRFVTRIGSAVVAGAMCSFVMAFPPRDLMMFELYGGRSAQLKNYQPRLSEPSVARLVSSYQLGVYANALYTPWYKTSSPIDLLIGYEYCTADRQVILEGATGLLAHEYSTRSFSADIVLNVLDFADLSLAGGAGLSEDLFTHDRAGTVYYYLQRHPQVYVMPGASFNSRLISVR